MALIDDYKQQLFDYARFLADNKLREQGKIVEGTKAVYVIYARKSTVDESKVASYRLKPPFDELLKTRQQSLGRGGRN